MKIFLTYSGGANKLRSGDKKCLSMWCCCNISASYVYPSVAGEVNTRVTIFPPAVFRRKGWRSSFSEPWLWTHLRHTSLLLQWEFAFSFPRMPVQSSSQKFIFTSKFACKRVCFVFLLLLTVKCLFCIGDHVLALGMEGGVFSCKSLRPILTHSEEVSAK